MLLSSLLQNRLKLFSPIRRIAIQVECWLRCGGRRSCLRRLHLLQDRASRRLLLPCRRQSRLERPDISEAFESLGRDGRERTVEFASLLANPPARADRDRQPQCGGKPDGGLHGRRFSWDAAWSRPSAAICGGESTPPPGPP